MDDTLSRDVGRLTYPATSQERAQARIVRHSLVESLDRRVDLHVRVCKQLGRVTCQGEENKSTYGLAGMLEVFGANVEVGKVVDGRRARVDRLSRLHARCCWLSSSNDGEDTDAASGEGILF